LSIETATERETGEEEANSGNEVEKPETNPLEKRAKPHWKTRSRCQKQDEGEGRSWELATPKTHGDSCEGPAGKRESLTGD